MHRLGIILRVIASSYQINVEEFEKYTFETAEEILRVYNFYKMPPSLHIILIHGASIIKNTVLPIGKLSEEAIETSHKIIRKFRKHHARSVSRIQTNEDVFKRLLINSDPKLSQIRCNFIPKKKFHLLTDEIKKLIIVNNNVSNELNIQSNDNNDNENELMQVSDDSDSELDFDSDSEDLFN